MKATVSWWNLADSDQTIDSLRDYLREGGVSVWTSVRGLRLKFWISDREGDRWGAIMLWESADARLQPLPPHRATELIGYPPNERWTFDVEATVEGVHDMPGLAGLGLAFERPEDSP